MIKAALFDMDGLMFDTESAYSVVHEKMCSKRGKNFTIEAKNTLMGKRANEVMALLNEYWSKNENIEDLLKEQDEELTHLYKTQVEKLPGLDELIDKMNERGIVKCICTSSRRFLVDLLLEKHQLEKEFKIIISGDVLEKGKPDPEIYNTCITKLDLKSEECLVLEDSLNGIKSGNAAGCITCAIPSKYTEHEDFSSANLTVERLNDQEIVDFLSFTSSK